ncbi:MAG: ATP-binding protein [Hyphomicrobiaceae bacterium]
MTGSVGAPDAHSGGGSSEEPSGESGRHRHWRSLAERFVLLALVFAIAGVWIYPLARDAVAHALAAAGAGGWLVAVDALAASAAVMIALLALFGGWRLQEQLRQARARERDEAARRRTNARIHFLAGHARDCIILCDAAGRIMEANERCLETYGYAQEAWPGLTMHDLSADRRFSLPGLIQQIPEARGVVCECRHARSDGTAFKVEIRASPTEVDGKPCYQLIIRDVSEQRAMRQEQGAYAQRLSELARRLVNVQEEERQRLAEELHDQVGANLATINLNLRWISRMLPNPDPQLLADRLKESGTLLADTLFSIRNSCTELRPAILYYSGLVPALKELVQRVGRRGDMEVVFRLDGVRERLSPQAESMLFRIAQEALTNCAKHSNASRVEVALAQQARAVVMTVSDNGKGFDARQPGSLRAGLGLLTMRERAAMAGGQLSLISSPGKGAQIRVVVALSRPQPTLRESGEMRG